MNRHEFHKGASCGTYPASSSVAFSSFIDALALYVSRTGTKAFFFITDVLDTLIFTTQRDPVKKYPWVDFNLLRSLKAVSLNLVKFQQPLRGTKLWVILLEMPQCNIYINPVLQTGASIICSY